MDTSPGDNNKDLASFLIRKFAARPPTGGGEGGIPQVPEADRVHRSQPSAADFTDEEIVAYALGGLLPARRREFSRALLTSPEFRDALAFAESYSVATKQGRRLKIAIAAAAVLLGVSSLAPLWLTRTSDLDRASQLLAAGNTRGALAILDETKESGRNRDRLVAIARFAQGDGDPSAGLTLDPSDIDFLPLSLRELEARDPGVLRNGASTKSVQLGPRGQIFDLRPTFVVPVGREPMDLIVHRADTQDEVFSQRIAAQTSEGSLELPLPLGTPDLEPNFHYWVEVRTLEGTSVDQSRFAIVRSDLRVRCLERSAELEKYVSDATLRDMALGTLYFNQDFCFEAVRRLSAIPANRHTAISQRMLEIALRRLRLL